MKYWRFYNSAEKEVGFVPQIVEPLFDQLWNMHERKLDEHSIIPKSHLQKKPGQEVKRWKNKMP